MISVIIPVFNSQNYISRCIESILNQKIRMIELILVDDGSTDRSVNIIRKYAKQDTRVRLIQQTHSGVSIARNKGLSSAKGDLIFFLDSDDYIEKNSLSELLKLQEESDADIICTQPTSDSSRSKEIPYTYKLMSGKKALKMFLNVKKVSGYAWGKVYKRQILENITFPENMNYGEDGVFSYMAILHSRRVIYSDMKFYHYEKRENSLTGRTADYSSKNLNAFSQISYIKNNVPNNLKRYVKVFEFSIYLNELGVYNRSSNIVKNKYYRQYELMKSFCDSNWLNVLLRSTNIRIKLSALKYFIKGIG